MYRLDLIKLTGVLKRKLILKITDLKLFIKVVKLGSFTAAATALDLPRANVSRRINDLEESLQTQLFHRTTRKLSLTNQAESYYHDLVKALDMLDAANQSLINNIDTIKGVIKVGIIPECHDILQSVLFSFIDKYPGIELDLRVISNGFNDMHNQGLDISFHAGRLIDSDLVARKLFKFERCLIASPSYIEKNGLPESIEALANHQALCFRWPTGEVEREWYFANGSITVDSKFVSNSADFVKSAAISGRGIAFFPNVLVSQDIKEGKLIPLLTHEPPIKELCYLLYHPTKTLNLATKTLIEFLLEELPNKI